MQSETWNLCGVDHRWFKRSTRKKRFLIRDNNSNNNNNNTISVVLSANHLGALGLEHAPCPIRIRAVVLHRTGNYLTWFCWALIHSLKRKSPIQKPVYNSESYKKRLTLLYSAILFRIKDSTSKLWATLSVSRNIQSAEIDSSFQRLFGIKDFVHRLKSEIEKH
jgi:hypothetical protein